MYNVMRAAGLPPPGRLLSPPPSVVVVRSDLAAPRPATNWEGRPQTVARTSQRLYQFEGLLVRPMCDSRI